MLMKNQSLPRRIRRNHHHLLLKKRKLEIPQSMNPQNLKSKRKRSPMSVLNKLQKMQKRLCSKSRITPLRKRLLGKSKSKTTQCS